MSTGKAIVIALLATGAGLLGTGCSSGSSTHTLRENADVSSFVADAARGHAKWKLSAQASPLATQAWRQKRAIEEVGEGLRAWPEWGCKSVGMLARGEESVVAALAVERDGAAVQLVNLLVPVAEKLTRAELHELVGVVCAKAQQQPS